MRVPGDTDYSDDAIRKATGHGRDHWYRLLDSYGDLDHRGRAGRLTEDAPGLSGWWVQMVTVDYERARGLREVGQSSKGDYQVSCSKTVPWSAKECFERIVSRSWLPGADWTQGTVWEVDGAQVEVRIVEPAKQLRFFWTDHEGKGVVVVAVAPNAKGDKHQITIAHSGISSPDARERYRARWKDALKQIVL